MHSESIRAQLTTAVFRYAAASERKKFLSYETTRLLATQTDSDSATAVGVREDFLTDTELAPL